MTRRLVITYLTITAFALAALAIPFGITFAHREKERVLFDIERDADAIAALIGDGSGAANPSTRSQIAHYVQRTGGHVIVVDVGGRALVDTEHPGDPGRFYATASRPEIRAALEGRRVEGTRHSDTLRATLLYAAVPTTSGGHFTGAVRVTYPSATLDARVRRMWGRVASLCLGVLLAVAVVGFVLARGVTRPVRRLERATNRLADADLSARVDDRVGPPELRNLAATFNRMADQLTRLVDAQQLFIADASHQLRTPLTALRLRLENLGMHARTADREAIDAAASEVTRMSRLVDALLFLARGVAAPMAPSPVDVSAIVRNRADVWSDVVAERSVRVVVDAPPSAWALAVPEAVDQFVDNLLDNATNVSDAGATITVRVEMAGTTVEVHVVDEGPGLDATEREQAFERFWRAPAAPAGGSGLGLAVVRQLAEASGGHARLDAGPTGGLDAVVVLNATAPARDVANLSSR
jgi:signal transduction histidine kinase